MAGDASKNKSDKLSKVRSNAIAGVGKRGGAARDAGRKVEKRKAKSRSALDFARKQFK